ncbi:major capsid protein E [Cronobacter phage JC01]|uniref:Major capsid protein n=1 Tax=Cronobacter phage JC01 TaxID=2729575 RepID=A0A6M3YNM2_9CAUD|nr:major head protein [Cronobacter phage JC01]QJI52235.1 major capsid protein E [Cronobacter phage JC01]
MAGLYDTYRLLATQRKFKQLPTFFLNWFTSQVNFPEDKIAFDKVSTDLTRIAPFVAPTAQGKVIREEGHTMTAFKPAYVKPKHVIDPNMIIPRQPGEALATGSLTIDQRRQAVIAFLLRKHRAMHENTWEWMAAQALLYGYVDVEGENYPKTRVDFGRDPALTGTVNWAAAGYTFEQAMEDLYMMRRLANDKSVSAAVTVDHVFGGDAWAQFAKIGKEALFGRNGLMDTTVGGSETRITRLWDGFEGVEYMGTIAGLNGGGKINVWVNTQKFRDEKNESQYLMPQDSVLGVSQSVDGVRCFGAVLDKAAGYQALEYFPKMWENEDPSVEYLMTQGAPLMVPRDPNATYLLKVL